MGLVFIVLSWVGVVLGGGMVGSELEAHERGERWLTPVMRTGLFVLIVSIGLLCVGVFLPQA